MSDDLLNTISETKQNLIKLQVENEWNKLKPKLEEAAGSGSPFLKLQYGINRNLKIYLESAGYKVETERGDYMSSGYTVIRW